MQSKDTESTAIQTEIEKYFSSIKRKRFEKRYWELNQCKMMQHISDTLLMQLRVLKSLFKLSDFKLRNWDSLGNVGFHTRAARFLLWGVNFLGSLNGDVNVFTE